MYCFLALCSEFPDIEIGKKKQKERGRRKASPQSVEEAGVKREQNTGFFEIEVQKEGEGEGNRADGNPATSV